LNTYTILQRKSDGRWDVTYKNNGIVRPYGYCHAFVPLDKMPNLILPDKAIEENKKYEASAHKYHSHGHETKEEAAECFRQYLLDHYLNLNGWDNESLRHKCAICDAETEFSAEITMTNNSWCLCKKHLNRESVESLFNIGKDFIIYSSY